MRQRPSRLCREQCFQSSKTGNGAYSDRGILSLARVAPATIRVDEGTRIEHIPDPGVVIHESYIRPLRYRFGPVCQLCDAHFSSAHLVAGSSGRVALEAECLWSVLRSYLSIWHSCFRQRANSHRRHTALTRTIGNVSMRPTLRWSRPYTKRAKVFLGSRARVLS